MKNIIGTIRIKLEDRLDMIREVWPYLTHPYRISKLIDEKWFWIEQFEDVSVESLRDERVRQLQDELRDRKAAYDEAEQQYDSDLAEIEADFQKALNFVLGENRELRAEVDNLKQLLAASYAKNAELSAQRAAAIAETEYLRAADLDCVCKKYNAVPTPTSPADR